MVQRRRRWPTTKAALHLHLPVLLGHQPNHQSPHTPVACYYVDATVKYDKVMLFVAVTFCFDSRLNIYQPPITSNINKSTEITVL